MPKATCILTVLCILLIGVTGAFAQERDPMSLPKGELIEVPQRQVSDRSETSPRLLDAQGRVAAETVVFEETFEAGASAWSTSGSWAIGTPRGGPGSGFNSASAAVTNLAGSYSSGASTRLTSPSISLPAAAENETFTLRFAEWFEIESGYDDGYVEISDDDGTSWTTMRSRDGASGWRTSEVDLTAYAGEDIRLRFRLDADESNAYAGWHVDDVRITSSTAEPLSATVTSLNSQNFPNIYANVAVDTAGAGFPNLNQENFAVYENGTLQADLFNVTPPEQSGGVRRADVVFLMDNSSSMSEEQAAVENNVFDFVDALSASDVDFAMGLARYGASQNGGNPILEDDGSLTSNAAYFKNDVWTRNAISGSYEPGYYTMTQSASGFNFRPGAQRVFIIITDEEPGQGGATQSEALAALETSDATLFALTESRFYDEFQPLTSATGGQLFDIYSSFDDILNFIATQVADTYVVSYRSSDPEFDGTTRTVRVEVTHEGNMVNAEATYVPGAAPSIQRTAETVALGNEGRAEETPLTIAAEITDGVAPGVASATLFYKQTPDPESAYIPVQMTNTGGNVYQAEIPGGAVVTPGLDYYITATDGQTTSSSPSTNPGADPYQIAILPNEPPQITHKPVTEATAAEPIDVAFTATDGTNELERVRLYFRRAGRLNYAVDTLDSFVNQSDFVLTIPDSIVTTDGVEYYIEATDDLGISSTSGTTDTPYSIPVTEAISFRVVDVNGEPVADKKFDVYNVTDHDFGEEGPPTSPLGSRTTDEQGHLDVSPAWLAEGEKIKIERVVDTVRTDNPAYNDSDADLGGVRYRVKIDNARFDSTGDISYPSVMSSDDSQELPLEHTTIVQNLAVSVEWDASSDYLQDVLAGMKRTSNYLYDVTDGQFYIAKVGVFDNAKHWSEVDIRRYATNQLWYDGKRYGAFRLGPRIFMPRQWEGTFDDTRNKTYPSTNLPGSSDDYRTMGHELGHLLFNFGDEYVTPSNFNFGFMDSQYESSGSYASEMSSTANTPNSEYRTTDQWKDHKTHCWNEFEKQFENTCNDIACPIKKPSERPTGDQSYLLGPNNDADDLTVNVGSKTENKIDDEDTGAFALPRLIANNSVGVPAAEVKLLKEGRTLEGGSSLIEQGKTDDAGQIVILGAHANDVVRVSGCNGGLARPYECFRRKWVIPASNRSLASSDTRSGNSMVASASQDSLVIEVEPIDGDFREVGTASFSGQSTVDFTATFEDPLPATPTFELYNNADSPSSSSFSASQGSRYSISVDEALGETGFFSLNTEDNSSRPFFIDHDYVFYDSLSVSGNLELSGPGGSGALILDSLNTSMQKLLMLTSSFPPIFNGLPEEAEQAGDAQIIASYPSGEFEGTNALTIRYADSDLSGGSESSLKVFQWQSGAGTWEEMGGMVDTVRNAVVTEVSAPGTYAAFTTELENPSENIEEVGLSQNYPNPFTRTTTITYALPEAQHVTLRVFDMLGRRVATLANERMEAGEHTVPFNAGSRGLASGVYLYRLTAGRHTETGKMVLVR